MNDLYLVSPIPVSVNHYVQSRGMLVHGKVIVTVYETAEARAYKASFAEASKKLRTLTDIALLIAIFILPESELMPIIIGNVCWTLSQNRKQYGWMTSKYVKGSILFDLIQRIPALKYTSIQLNISVSLIPQMSFIHSSPIVRAVAVIEMAVAVSCLKRLKGKYNLRSKDWNVKNINKGAVKL